MGSKTNLAQLSLRCFLGGRGVFAREQSITPTRQEGLLLPNFLQREVRLLVKQPARATRNPMCFWANLASLREISVRFV
jgi:hypothetical protein